MSRKTLYKKSRREQVYDRLYRAVMAPDSYEGKRLSPVKDLAQQLDTSVRTVQLAMEQLEREGYVKRRHGVGTFVARQRPALTPTDHVVVAMDMQDEVWGTLAGRIVRELHASGRVPISIDLTHGDAAELLHRAARGDVNTFIIRGARCFPYALLEEPAFRDKQIVAVEEWASSYAPPRMYQVLHDYAYGGEQLARYLYELGHRRVVIVGAPNSLTRLNRRDGIVCGAARGHAFLDYWTARGGQWVGLPSRRDAQSLSGIDIDLAPLLEELTGPAPGIEPATAVFGYRDVEAWTVQSLLQRHRPDLLLPGGVEIVGYGDTFWSRAARPPLTTVAHPVEDMFQWVRQLFDTTLAGLGPAPVGAIMVRPQLIDRSGHPLRTQSPRSTVPAPAPDPGPRTSHPGALVQPVHALSGGAELV